MGAQFGTAEYRRQEQRIKARPQLLAQRAAAETQSRAINAASTEAEKNRKFRRESFSRFSASIKPLLAKLQGDNSETAGTGDAQQALTASIEQRGEQAQSALSSQLAKRGIFRGGASAAASAKLQGETEAAVAGQRAAFAESKSERRARERIARKQALSNVTSSFIQGAGAFL